MSAAGDLRKLLDDAVAAKRNGQTRDLQTFINYVQKSTDRGDQLLQIIKDIWRDKIPIQSANSISLNVSQRDIRSDVLLVCLSIDEIWQGSISLCINSILDGQLYGKCASICIASVSNSIMLTTSKTYNHAELHTLVHFLSETAYNCARSILEIREHMIDPTECLDIVKPCIEVIATFGRRKFVDSTFDEILTNLIENILELRWGKHSTVFLHLFDEIYEFVNHQQILMLKRKVTNDLSASDDHANLFLCCLKLFERSADCGWVSVLRIIYSNVRLENDQTVEAVLEHALKISRSRLAVDNCLRVIQVLEDLTIQRIESTEIMDLEYLNSDLKLILLLFRSIKSDSNALDVLNNTIEDIKISVSKYTDNFHDQSVLTPILQTSRTFFFLVMFGNYKSAEGREDSVNLSSYFNGTKIIDQLLEYSYYDKVRVANSKWTINSRASDVFVLLSTAANYPEVVLLPSLNYKYRMDIKNSKSSKTKQSDCILDSDRNTEYDNFVVEFLSDIICGLFRSVSTFRETLFVLIIRNIVELEHEHQGENKIQNLKLVMKIGFQKICLLYSDNVMEIYGEFQKFIPMFSMLSNMDLENVLSPLIHVALETALNENSPSLISLLLHLGRKSLLSNDAERSLIGIKFLLKLLPVLNNHEQIDTISSILGIEESKILNSAHCFRSNIYISLFFLLDSCTLESYGKKLSPNTLFYLRKVLHRRLQMHFILINSLSGQHTYSCNIDLENNIILRNHVSYLCVDRLSHLSDPHRSEKNGSNQKHFIQEDIYRLILTAWRLESLLYPDNCLNYIQYICYRILRGQKTSVDVIVVPNDVADIWPCVIFDGIVNFIENGLLCPVSFDRLQQQSSCVDYNTAQLISIYGAISALLYCICNASYVHGNATPTTEDLITKLANCDSDVGEFYKMAEVQLTQVVYRPKKSEIEKATRAQRKSAEDFNFLSKMEELDWGLYTLKKKNIDFVMNILKYLEARVLSVMHVDMQSSNVNSLPIPISIILSSMKFSLYNINCTELPKTEAYEILDYLTQVYSLIGMDKHEAIIVEKTVKNLEKLKAICLPVTEKNTRKLRSTKSSSRQRKSIYAEYSDLSDFDEYTPHENNSRDYFSSLMEVRQTSEQNDTLNADLVITSANILLSEDIARLFCCFIKSVLNGNHNIFSGKSLLCLDTILFTLIKFSAVMSNYPIVNIDDTYMSDLRRVIGSVRYELHQSIHRVVISLTRMLAQNWMFSLLNPSSENGSSRKSVLVHLNNLLCTDFITASTNSLTFRLFKSYIQTISGLTNAWMIDCDSNVDIVDMTHYSDCFVHALSNIRDLTPKLVIELLKLSFDFCISAGFQCIKILMISYGFDLKRHNLDGAESCSLCKSQYNETVQLFTLKQVTLFIQRYLENSSSTNSQIISKICNTLFLPLTPIQNFDFLKFAKMIFDEDFVVFTCPEPSRNKSIFFHLGINLIEPKAISQYFIAITKIISACCSECRLILTEIKELKKTECKTFAEVLSTNDTEAIRLDLNCGIPFMYSIFTLDYLIDYEDLISNSSFVTIFLTIKNLKKKASFNIPQFQTLLRSIYQFELLITSIVRMSEKLNIKECGNNILQYFEIIRLRCIRFVNETIVQGPEAVNDAVADDAEADLDKDISTGRKRKRHQRLRSRNTVVDQWLEDEDGNDIYADLEDFLVP